MYTLEYAFIKVLKGQENYIKAICYYFVMKILIVVFGVIGLIFGVLFGITVLTQPLAGGLTGGSSSFPSPFPFREVIFSGLIFLAIFSGIGTLIGCIYRKMRS